MSRDERPLGTELTRASVPPAIESGALELLGLLPNSSNYTFLARATPSPPGDPTLAVYKPHRGESPLWDFPEGSLGRREVAAYLVSVALGWPNVPPTVLREGPEGPGSVQLFVPFEPQEHYFTLQERFPDAFRAIAAFDLAVNNADRKGGHILTDEAGRVWGIDHGVTFSVEDKLRTVLWGWAGESIPDDVMIDVGRLHDTLGDGFDPVDRWLDDEERETLRQRVRSLLRFPQFPQPSGRWPAIPWPVF